MSVNIYDQFTEYVLLINEKVYQLFFYSEVYIQFCHLNYKQGNDLTTYVLPVFISEKIC